MMPTSMCFFSDLDVMAGRPIKVIFGLAPARSKYVCNVSSCKAEVVGYGIGTHYSRYYVCILLGSDFFCQEMQQ